MNTIYVFIIATFGSEVRYKETMWCLVSATLAIGLAKNKTNFLKQSELLLFCFQFVYLFMTSSILIHETPQ